MKIWKALLILPIALLSTRLPAAPDFKIVTAGERGTYIQIGKDLAQYVAKPAGIDLGVLPSNGSVENVKRLRYDPGIKLAIVQQDVYQAFLDVAATGDHSAADIIKPLRVILPLYDEEIYFLVAADSSLNYIHEIKGQKINIGPLGSGTALTGATLYRRMFNEQLPASATTLPNETALVKLLDDKQGVVMIVGGQPTQILAEMKPEVKERIKLLKLDPNNAATKEALKTYVDATVRQISYPNLLTADMHTFAVKALLVTYDFVYTQSKQRPSAAMLVKLAKSFCDNFDVLQESGHSKWRDVKMELPELGVGWSYYGPTERELRVCAAARQPAPAPVSVKNEPAGKVACSVNESVLGLCQ